MDICSLDVSNYREKNRSMLHHSLHEANTKLQISCLSKFISNYTQLSIDQQSVTSPYKTSQLTV